MDYPGVEIVHVITKNLNPNFAENAPCNRPLVLNTPFKNCLPICLSNYAPPPQVLVLSIEPTLQR